MTRASRRRTRRPEVSLLAAIVLLPVAALTGLPAAASSATVVPASNTDLRFGGRWDHGATSATTVNSGSTVRIAFTGDSLTATFDVAGVTDPPQLHVSVDGRPSTRYVVDRDRIDLAPAGLRGHRHVAEVVVKDVSERTNRWVPPLASGLRLTGFELAPGGTTLPLPAPAGPRMVFLGDSITQGVRAIGPQIGPNGSDATLDYAWLVGRAFGADFQQVGFGAQGITRGGGGGVPRAADALAWNFQGSPAAPFDAEMVVVNQGTNDGGSPSATFRPAYEAYLRQVRLRWPSAWIFAMRPLNGAHADDIHGAATTLDDPRLVYVDTSGWLRADEYTDGLHPSYSGHRAVASRLRDVITGSTGRSAARIRPATTGLLPSATANGFEDGTTQGWEAGDLVTSVAASTATPPRLAAPYDGSTALLAESSVAPLGAWRTVELRPDRPLTLPHARDVFVYVRVPAQLSATYDLRLSVTTAAGSREVTETDVINGYWNRLHVNLPMAGRQISAIRVSVRASGPSAAASDALPFQLDALGWTDVVDG